MTWGGAVRRVGAERKCRSHLRLFAGMQSAQEVLERVVDQLYLPGRRRVVQVAEDLTGVAGTDPDQQMIVGAVVLEWDEVGWQCLGQVGAGGR